MTLHALLFTDAPPVQRVGRTLAHTVWQGLAAAALLRLAFAVARDSARVRYALACTAMVAVAVAAAVTFVSSNDASSAAQAGPPVVARAAVSARG